MKLPDIDFGALPEISLGTAAMLIFGVIVSLAMLRGLMRIILGTLLLCASTGAAFFTWQYAPTYAADALAGGPTWLPFGLPVAAFILVFLIGRFLARFLISPLKQPNQEAAEKNRRSPIRWTMTLIFSLIPTAIVCLAGATLLRHLGSVAELKSYAQTLSQDPISKSTVFLVKLKQDIEDSIPSQWFDAVDPSTSDLRMTLAKLISTADSPPPKAVPVLETQAIRQIILSDPQLRDLARQGRYSEILRDPRLDQMLENPDLREVLKNLSL